MTRPTPEIDWPPVFSAEEYQARRKAVSRSLQEAGIDAIFVSNPADIYYLTGYDMIWYHLRCVSGCLLSAESAELIFFDSPAHKTIVELTPEIREIVWLTGSSFGEDSSEIERAIVDRGYVGKRVALQPWGYSPHASIQKALDAAISDKGVKTCNGSGIVERIRLYKSPAELEVMRKAAKIADEAMIAARDMLKPGILETEIEAAIMSSMMTNGGGDPAIRCMIGSGPRSGTHHSAAQHRKLGNNELVFIDFCASLHRYHVNLNRTFCIGDVDSRWYDLMQRAAQNVDAIVAKTGPGDLWTDAQKAADATTDANGIRDMVWFVGGYALGIAIPPDWVGELWVDGRNDSTDLLMKPGMVFNFEGQFDDTEGWAGGSGAAYIESLVVTETGLEVLSELPRTLTAV